MANKSFKIITLQSIAEPEKMEHWGSLTDICRNHPELPYHTLKDEKIPVRIRGVSLP